MPGRKSDTKCRVLALLWHAPQQVITAGGFRRTYEIFKRTPAAVELFVLDDRPTFLKGLETGQVRVEEFRIPGAVRLLEQKHFWVERVIEWMLTTVILIFRCGLLRIRGERFDLIFVPSSEQVPALIAGIAAKLLFRAPLVACNLNIDIFPLPVRKPLVWLHNRADKVIAISEHLGTELRSYGLKVPVELNGVGLDTKIIDESPRPDSKQYEAVFVGRHDTEKGVFDLLDIWRDVTGQMPGAGLVMIGSSNPTNKAKLEGLIAQYALQDNVTLAGTVDDRTKYSLIKASKICLFPSYVEEWGIVPQEALACGLPVVAYDLPVFRENIKPCPAVFLEPIGDIRAAADCALSLLEGEEYLRYESVGPEFVSAFDWDMVAVREFEIMIDMAGAPRAGGVS
ncbi:MAG: glycosyltransferase family 4 protein [Candidatus Geothermincolia bacterium]